MITLVRYFAKYKEDFVSEKLNTERENLIYSN